MATTNTETLPRRAFVGVELAPRSAGDSRPGLEVTAVLPDGSAERAGLVAGDRLIALDGTRVNDATEVTGVARRLALGEPLFFVVERDSARFELVDEVRAMPTEAVDGGRVVLRQVDVGASSHRAIFTVPDGAGPHPLVYFLPGAGWRSIEFPLEPDAPVRTLVQAFTRAGFATLRVDRSGVGDSGGPHCTEVGFTSELDAYRAGFDLANDVDFVRPDGVVLLGHSLGGMVAPLIASSAGRPPRGVAVFGTSAEPWHDCMLASTRRSLELVGFEGERLTNALVAIEELQELVFVRKMTPDAAFEARPSLRSVPIDDYRGDRAFGRTVRYYQELQALDLRAAWQGVHLPVLSIHGENDWVTSLEDSERIGRITSGTAVSLPKVDHQMRASESMRWSLEHRSGGRLSAEFAATVTDWFRAQVSR